MVKEERLFSDLEKSVLTPVKLANGEKNYDYGNKKSSSKNHKKST